MTAYASLSETPHKFHGCCPEADPDPCRPSSDSKKEKCVLIGFWVCAWTVWVVHVLLFFNASWKYPRFKALNQWFLWLKRICVVCRNISCLHRGTVFYGKCSRGVKFSGNYGLLITNKPIPSAFWTPDTENRVNSPLNLEKKSLKVSRQGLKYNLLW